MPISTAWLKTLSCREQRIALLQSEGYTTSEVADRFQLSAGRISQLRRELSKSWEVFQADERNAAARRLPSHGLMI